MSGTHCFPLKLSTPDTGPDSMGVESVQPPREPWTDVKTRCRRRQANARGRVGSFKVSPRAPRVLVSTSLSLSGGVGVPASAPTHAQQAHAMAGLHSNSKTYQQLESWRFRGWLVGSCCCSATRPLFACPPPPVPASSRRRSIRFAKCRIHVSILRPQTSQEKALFLGSHALSTGTRSKAGHKGDSGHSTPWRAEEKRGHSNPPITARRLNMVSQTRVGRLAGQAETA